ncbi:hypothetical protein FS837_007262, partial [Tulasnella sp. UAMH 9824]
TLSIFGEGICGSRFGSMQRTTGNMRTMTRAYEVRMKTRTTTKSTGTRTCYSSQPMPSLLPLSKRPRRSHQQAAFSHHRPNLKSRVQATSLNLQKRPLDRRRSVQSLICVYLARRTHRNLGC